MAICVGEWRGDRSWEALPEGWNLRRDLAVSLTDTAIGKKMGRPSYSRVDRAEMSGIV